MILVDTSIWIDHLGIADERLAELLMTNAILMHPYVVGEIALGDLSQRARTIADLMKLPRATIASMAEVLAFVERHKLFGSGIGLVDAHLIASVYLTPDAFLWTRDKRLRAVADRLGVSADVD